MDIVNTFGVAFPGGIVRCVIAHLAHKLFAQAHQELLHADIVACDSGNAQVILQQAGLVQVIQRREQLSR